MGKRVRDAGGTANIQVCLALPHTGRGVSSGSCAAFVVLTRYGCIFNLYAALMRGVG